jgi:phosphoribosylformylglycinamidine synthase PurS subunit
VVRLKEGLLDPQGKAIEESLPHLGWTNVSDVRVGKYIELTVETDDLDSAVSAVDDVAKKLLSNPVIETAYVNRLMGGHVLGTQDDPTEAKAL